MRAITLTQPWAALVALGAKTVETRSWSPASRVPRGTPLAIHAGQGLAPVGGERGLERIYTSPEFYEALWWEKSITLGDLLEDLRGVIVAVATLDGWAPTGFGIYEGDDIDYVNAAGRSASRTVTPREHAFGDYGPGRWLWMLSSIRPLARPVPCKGALGLWEVPPDVVAQIEAQL